MMSYIELGTPKNRPRFLDSQPFYNNVKESEACPSKSAYINKRSEYKAIGVTRANVATRAEKREGVKIMRLDRRCILLWKI